MANEFVTVALEELETAHAVTDEDLFLLKQNGAPKKMDGETLRLWLLQMADGHGGIYNIAKTSTSGLVDTYTITLADGTTSTFSVTNGVGITEIEHVRTEGQDNIYRIHLTGDGSFDYVVRDGDQGPKGDNAYIHVKWAQEEPYNSDEPLLNTPSRWMGVYTGTSAAAPADFSQYKWQEVMGPQGPVGPSPTMTLERFGNKVLMMTMNPDGSFFTEYLYDGGKGDPGFSMFYCIEDPEEDANVAIVNPNSIARSGRTPQIGDFLVVPSGRLFSIYDIDTAGGVYINYRAALAAGAGSAPADWDENEISAAGYILNRPFYTETVKTTIFDGTVTEGDGYKTTCDTVMEAGKTYTAVYTLAAAPVSGEAKQITRYGITWTYIGNPVNFGSEYENNGQLFTVATTDANGQKIIWFPHDGSFSSITFSLTLEEDVVHQIPQKYVPQVKQEPILIRYNTDEQKYEASCTHEEAWALSAGELQGRLLIDLTTGSMITKYCGAQSVTKQEYLGVKTIYFSLRKDDTVDGFYSDVNEMYAWSKMDADDPNAFHNPELVAGRLYRTSTTTYSVPNTATAGLVLTSTSNSTPVWKEAPSGATITSATLTKVN